MFLELETDTLSEVIQNNPKVIEAYLGTTNEAARG